MTSNSPSCELKMLCSPSLCCVTYYLHLAVGTGRTAYAIKSACDSRMQAHLAISQLLCFR
jgi:hypothetical protein